MYYHVLILIKYLRCYSLETLKDCAKNWLTLILTVAYEQWSSTKVMQTTVIIKYVLCDIGHKTEWVAYWQHPILPQQFHNNTTNAGPTGATSLQLFFSTLVKYLSLIAFIYFKPDMYFAQTFQTNEYFKSRIYLC